ncbi:hypothetical protein [Arenimonas sp. MALMAid1274]|uniref:hypothetical protein n=1 Tax=Arenimonas sp. MALMAid1274 TaxID=3411630 RepID=UPI003B9F1EF2
MKTTRSEFAMRALLLVPALIHLLPVSGVLGPDALARLYGLDFSDPTLELLMRHRAVLFGGVGGLLLAAIALRHLRSAALLVGLASVVSFLGLAWLTGTHGPLIGRVVVADWIALGCLGASAALHFAGAATGAANAAPPPRP